MRLFLTALALLCGMNAHAEPQRVDAGQYRAFWLWAAVRPQPVLHQASALYLHQGEIVRRQGETRFLHQGIDVSRLKVPALWLSVRVATLDVPEPLFDSLLTLRQRWIAAGNPVAGIQIDFDAASYQLGRYADFLRQLRQRLPPDCRLSVTGLLDWAKTGDISQLNALAIDELVIQTYQGRHTVNGYQAYLPPLLRLTLPFRIGLVQGGEWDPEWQRRLARSPYYRGEVVFLLNPR